MEIFVIISGLIAGLWAYLTYAIGRGIMPAIQLDIESVSLGAMQNKKLLEISYIIHNKGQYPLVVSDLYTKIRYIETGDDLITDADQEKSTYCRVIFPRSLGKLIKTGDPLSSELIDTSLPVVSHKTFVQPGVIQNYNLLISLPEKTEYVVVKGFLNYEIKALTGLPKLLLKLGVKMRLIPFLFQNIKEAHTIEKTFNLSNK